MACDNLFADLLFDRGGAPWIEATIGLIAHMCPPYRGCAITCHCKPKAIDNAEGENVFRDVVDRMNRGEKVRDTAEGFAKSPSCGTVP